MAQKSRRKAEAFSEPADYLKRPYSRTLIPEQDGSFRAEMIEFPGCIALSDTAPEALAMLEDIAASWLAAALERGQPIPEPMENLEFSGKFVLRLPKSLHKKAARVAERDGVSLNQFIVSSLAQSIGERSADKSVTPTAMVILIQHQLSFGEGTTLQTIRNPIGPKEVYTYAGD